MKNLIALAILFIVLPCLCEASALSVTFQKQAVVDGDDVTLGSVAAITPAGKRARNLAAISLGVAPAPGTELRLQSRDLWARLCRLEPGLNSANYHGADVVMVRRAGTPFGPQKVKQLLETYLRKQQERFPGLQLNLVKLQLPKAFILSKGSIHTEIRPSDPGVLHSRSFNILFRIADKPVKNIVVRGQLEAIATIPVMVRDLPRGTIIEPSDYRMVKRNIVPLRSPCLSPSEFLGKKTKRSLRQGQPVARTSISTPPVIKRGELVTISLKHGTLELAAKGIARSNGITGDTIPVRNSNSQRDVLCKVEGPGLVKVGF